MLSRRKPMRNGRVGGWYGVTVSYIRVDGKMATSRAGYGKTFDQALRDADSQLSDGVWRRAVVSHPGSVYSDLQSTRAARFARNTMRKGEGVIVRVEKRISTEIPVR